MMRLHTVSVLGLLSAAIATAGQIQIGGTNGLTTNYITQGSGAVCAAGAGDCITGSLGSFAERSYDVRLFAGATENGTPPVPYSTYNQTTPETGTLGQFAMINDGTIAGSSENFWDAVGEGTITVPIGVSNVTDVWTMLNNVWGVEGANDTVVTFDFGTTPDATTYNNIVVVDLQNAGTATSSPSGQIGSSVDCSTSPCGVNNLANGVLAASSTPTTSLDSNPALLTVTTENLFTTGNAYNNIAAGTYAGTSGNLSLDAQDFDLGALVAPSPNEYLVAINVLELEGGANNSQTALSAVTVDTASATPEPASVFLFLAGLGAIGLARIRRK